MSDYKTAINSAIETINKADYDTMKATFEKLSKDYPQEFEPYYYLSILEGQKNNFQTAVYYAQNRNRPQGVP